MDYKEKYEQALDRAKEMYDAYRFSVDQSNFKPTDFEYIFPELKESEDERIRKAIHIYLDWLDGRNKDYRPKGEYTIRDMIAWLEKQGQVKESEIFQHENKTCEENGDSLTQDNDEQMPADNATIVQKDYTLPPQSERKSLRQVLNDMKNDVDYFVRYAEEFVKEQEQKPADKVEPKFHEGQWIVWQGKCYKVNYIGCQYELIDQNGISTVLWYSTVDESAHLWTVEDAKNGNVLFSGEVVFIFNLIHGEWLNCCCVSHIYDGSFTVESEDLCTNKYFDEVYPATKEQRDLLFQRMKEAGYDIFQSWDTEKLELRKIEQKPNDESWQDKLANLNEKLAECSKYNVRILNTGDGLYMCNILDDGIEDEVYAENFYEDELYDLIDSVQNYLMNKINEQR